MSNDKVAATFHGLDEEAMHFLVGSSRTSCGLRVTDDLPTTKHDSAVMCESCLTVLAFVRQNQRTTGEHTKAKLADNPYGGVTGAQAAEAVVWGISQLAQHTGSSIPGVPYDYGKAEGTDEYANAYLRDLGPALHKAPAPWTPSGRQLAVAGGIAAVIVVLLGWLLLSL